MSTNLGAIQFGFRVRSTQRDRELLESWPDVLGWWMNEPEMPEPPATELRAWQRFVSDNLEFRLGVAVGAIVAKAWFDGTSGELVAPNLEDWKETTGLPWFGFWARELLRWGTHDPFVAFCLAQGLAKAREEASGRRDEFDVWLHEQRVLLDPEDRIDPQLFQQWQRTLPANEQAGPAQKRIEVELSGTNGQDRSYAVIPLDRDGKTAWLDPAGFELALSAEEEPENTARYKSDYHLLVDRDQPSVAIAYRA